MQSLMLPSGLEIGTVREHHGLFDGCIISVARRRLTSESNLASQCIGVRGLFIAMGPWLSVSM